MLSWACIKDKQYIVHEIFSYNYTSFKLEYQLLKCGLIFVFKQDPDQVRLQVIWYTLIIVYMVVWRCKQLIKPSCKSKEPFI
jgi:hypothetical protein